MLDGQELCVTKVFWFFFKNNFDYLISCFLATRDPRILTIIYFSLSDQCPGVKRNIFKEILHFWFMSIWEMNTPYHKNPGEGGHDIYNFGKPFLGYFYHILPWLT